MTTLQIGRIFISYRRADSAGYAGRIYDRLTAHFGEDAVFMDVDTIEAGVDFVEVLQNAVQSCDVLVALIGRRWLDGKDANGKRRLDNPEDFVRIEIAAALERDIRVIPVLVDGVSMPYSTQLPENIKSLARRNALQVDHHSFNADARRLISQLELALKAAEDSRILKARKLQEERERKEREASEAEERKRVERRAQEKRAAEERTRKEEELPEKARMERIEREKREAEDETRKAVLRKARQGETVERLKNIFRSEIKPLFFVGGGIVILFLLVYIIKNATPPMPTLPTEISATIALPSATSTEISSTSTPTSTNLPTEIPLTPTFSLLTSVARPSNSGGPGDALKLTGDATSGAQIFQANCVPCHGPQGTQGVPNPGTDDDSVPTLNPIDPTMVSSNYKTFAYNIDLFVQHGSTPAGPNPSISMPAWGDQGALTQQQIADVIAYIISLNIK